MFSVLIPKNKLPEYYRWLSLALLVFALFLLGLQESFLHRGLGAGWVWVSSFIGLPERLREFTTHSYPYRIICVTLCIALVHVYFMNWSKTKPVLYFYGAAFLLCVLLVWIGKGSEQEESLAYEVAKKLISAMVSPFLAVVLIPVLYLFNNETAPVKAGASVKKRQGTEFSATKV